MRYKNMLHQAYSEFESQLNATTFSCFQSAIIELSCLFEDKKIQVQDGIKGRFVFSILNRFMQECFGLIACLRGGTFYAAYHHLRDLLETVAIFHYALKHQDSKSKWIERYIEFVDVFRFNHEKNLSPSKRKISKSEFERLLSKKSYWIKLYNPKSKETDEIKKWSKKLTNEETIQELGTDLKLWLQTESEPTGVSEDEINPYDLVFAYNYYCHYTHFSPLFSQSHIKMIGLPDGQTIEGLIREVSPLVHIFLLLGEKHAVFKSFNLKDHVALMEKLSGKG